MDKDEMCRQMAHEAAERLFSNLDHEEHSGKLDILIMNIIYRACRKDAREAVRAAVKDVFTQGYEAALLENDMIVISDKPLPGRENIKIVVNACSDDD